MSKEAVLDFLKAAIDDEDLEHKVKHRVTSPKLFVEVGFEHGYEFTEQEIMEELDDLSHEFLELEITPGAGTSATILDVMLQLCRHKYNK